MQGKIAKQILSPAQHMNNVSDIIMHQYESVNTSALPEKIKTGIKVLAIARDYWRYASGKILPKNLNHIHIHIELNKGRSTKYDEGILDLLKAHPELVDDVMLEKGITTQQVKPGMLLKYNLYTINHLLILAEGHHFTESSITLLMEYEKNQKHVLSIVIDITNNKH